MLSLLSKVKNDDVWENVDIAKKIIEELQNLIETVKVTLSTVDPTDSIRICKCQTRIAVYAEVIIGITNILDEKSD